MGTAERRQREALARRHSILVAARKVFWNYGHARATMAQIAEEAELASGTLYLYFPNKDALYVELLSEGYELLLDRLRQEADREAGPAERAGGLIDAFFGFAQEHREYFDIIFFVLQQENTGGWEDNFPAEQVRRLHSCEEACKEVAGEILGRAGFGSAEKRTRIVDAVWSMLAGVVLFFRNRESFDDIARQARTLLLSAIFAAR